IQSNKMGAQNQRAGAFFAGGDERRDGQEKWRYKTEGAGRRRVPINFENKAQILLVYSATA
ncbi:MAG: hypothetical protein ACRENG_27290, partial [bacterium]